MTSKPESIGGKTPMHNQPTKVFDIVGTLVESSEKLDKEKHKVRTSVCVT